MNPHSPEAEQALLACYLMSPNAYIEAGHVSPDDFFLPQHRAVFLAVEAVRAAKCPVDLVTVGDELVRLGHRATVAELGTIACSVTLYSTAKHYAATVRKHSVNRRLIAICNEISVKASSADAGEEILSDARVALAELETRNGSEPMRLGDGLAGVFERVEAQARNKDSVYIKSGIELFDKEIGGFRSPQLIVIAARPGVGKTALATNILERAATRGIPSLIFSLEMSFDELAQRVVGADARFPVDRISRGDINFGEYKQLYARAPKLAEIPLWIEDRVMNVAQIEATARLWRLKHPNPQALIAIDYLGLIRPGSERAENRNLEVGAMARAAKTLAKDLACPVFLVAQLNRKMEQEQREPMLSDLRDSGEIEAHADMVIFPYREMGNNGSGPATLLVPKHRGGKTGRVPLYWNGPLMTYDNYADGSE